MLSREEILKIDRRFGDTEYFISASHTEKHLLWEGSSDRSPFAHYKTKLNWRQDSGVMLTVGSLSLLNQGKIEIMPVCVTFIFDWIDGRRVCFYEATSQVVDHRMVEEVVNLFVKQTKDGRPCQCDAMNFAHCIHHIKDLNHA